MALFVAGCIGRGGAGETNQAAKASADPEPVLRSVHPGPTGKAAQRSGGKARSAELSGVRQQPF